MNRLIRKAILSLIGLCVVFCISWAQENYHDPIFPSSNTPVELYSTENHDDLKFTFSKAIQSAEKSVLLLVYTLTDQTVIQALNQKAKEGIPVHVIVDAKAASHSIKRIDEKVHLIKRFGKKLMHLKILVVDDKLIWLGSANMTNESLEMHGNLVLGFDSPEMAAWIKQKADSLTESSRLQFYPSKSFEIGSQRVDLSFLPDDQKAAAKIKELIRNAKSSLRIAMFTWTRYDFAYEVIRAAHRGVNVEIVIDANSSRGYSSKVVDLFRKEGIPIKTNLGTGLLHHKMMIVDENTLVNGSANWTKAGFSDNDDCFIILYDLTQDQIKALQMLWNNILKNASPIQQKEAA